jgi:hypothetical protein
MQIIDPRVSLCLFQAAGVPEGPTATTALLIGFISPFKDDRVLSAEDFNNKLR